MPPELSYVNYLHSSTRYFSAQFKTRQKSLISRKCSIPRHWKSAVFKLFPSEDPKLQVLLKHWDTARKVLKTALHSVSQIARQKWKMFILKMFYRIFHCHIHCELWYHSWPLKMCWCWQIIYDQLKCPKHKKRQIFTVICTAHTTDHHHKKVPNFVN